MTPKEKAKEVLFLISQLYNDEAIGHQELNKASDAMYEYIKEIES